MNKIVVNVDAEKKLIETETKRCIDEVITNAQNGIPTTDLYIAKSVHFAVRDEIDRILKESGTRFTWQVVSRGYNEYTGRPESYQSETIGDEKHRRITIIN